jgi:hypothetical protein
MDTVSNNRNGTAIFAERVRKNLDFVVASGAAGQDVHPVTQAVSSLLGIIVFPWELSAFDQMKRQKLLILAQSKGWPRWTMTGPRRVLDVGQLLYLLRNCVAHGRIEFDSDSRDPAEVNINFVHVPKGEAEPDWQGRIQADKLVAFCRCFSLGMKGFVD